MGTPIYSDSYKLFVSEVVTKFPSFTERFFDTNFNIVRVGLMIGPNITGYGVKEIERMIVLLRKLYFLFKKLHDVEYYISQNKSRRPMSRDLKWQVRIIADRHWYPRSDGIKMSEITREYGVLTYAEVLDIFEFHKWFRERKI